MRLGRFDLEVLSDGEFRLDGGAMFGVVPRVLWQRQKTPDEKNRIRMGTNCLLVRAGDELVLIDTGVGDKNDDSFREMFGLQPGAARLPEALHAAGHEPAEVTHVLLTHLHFDHSGWNSRQDAAGRLVPTFPNARYWLERGEVAHARRPNDRDRSSYDPRNWEPLFEAGVVELFDDEAEPVAGIRAVKARGHNADMCIVLLDGTRRDEAASPAGAVFLADLVPTTAHLPYPWVMGFDLYPLETMENKKRWLPRAAAKEWLCVFEHDADVPLARLEEERPGRYRARPVEASAVLDGALAS